MDSDDEEDDETERIGTNDRTFAADMVAIGHDNNNAYTNVLEEMENGDDGVIDPLDAQTNRMNEINDNSNEAEGNETEEDEMEAEDEEVKDEGEGDEDGVVEERGAVKSRTTTKKKKKKTAAKKKKWGLPKNIALQFDNNRRLVCII